MRGIPASEGDHTTGVYFLRNPWHPRGGNVKMTWVNPLLRCYRDGTEYRFFHAAEVGNGPGFILPVRIRLHNSRYIVVRWPYSPAVGGSFSVVASVNTK